MRTILLVDDRPEKRYIAHRALAGQGYDVREAATARDALRLALLPPDLIVMDVKLPDMKGFDLCRRLKEDPRTQPIPVVLMSEVFTDDQDRQEGIEAGASSYVAGLLTADRLLDAVRSTLDSTRR